MAHTRLLFPHVSEFVLQRKIRVYAAHKNISLIEARKISKNGFHSSPLNFDFSRFPYLNNSPIPDSLYPFPLTEPFSSFSSSSFAEVTARSGRTRHSLEGTRSSGLYREPKAHFQASPQASFVLL